MICSCKSIRIAAMSVTLLSPTCMAFSDSACATSGVFALDSVMSMGRKSGSAITVNDSPKWSAETPGATAQVVISKVEHADTHLAVTSVVMRCEEGESGSLQIGPDASGMGCLRLLHSVEEGGSPVGCTLVSDVSFGVSATTVGNAVFDSRTNSLQCVAEAGEVAPLTYSTEWVTNGTPAQVVLTKVCDRYRRGALQSSVTTELFRTSAPADGVFNFLPNPEMGGTFSLRCTFLDNVGNPIDVGEASYRFKEKWGWLMLVY